MLFVQICPGCRAPSGGTVPCRRCAAELARSVPMLVEPPAGIDRLVACHRYEGSARSFILAAKHGGRRRDLHHHGAELAAMARALGPVDVVSWVPASRQGIRQRGYDQGRVLARAAARGLPSPPRRLLVRRPGPTRAGAGRGDRLGGPELRSPLRCPQRVLLVDDVVTTGASMAAAAGALRRAGARRVVGLAVAVAGTDPALLGPFDPDDHLGGQHYG